MSEKLFDIIFSGQIVAGAELGTVKQNIAQMFRADEARITQMFSGHKVVIKRQLDEATAARYRGAFQKAGALCEVRPVTVNADKPTETITEKPAASSSAPPAPTVSSGQVNTQSTAAYVSKYPESDQIPQALLTEPLGISGDEIEDIPADVAPTGSPMQYETKEVAEPVIDTSALGVAPVGSELTTGPEKEVPPPPDTSGLSMAD